MNRSNRFAQAIAIGVISTLVFAACGSKPDDGSESSESTIASTSGQSGDTTTTSLASASGGEWTTFPAGLSWQWQLSGKLDQSFDVDVYDIDGADNSAEVVDQLQRAGRKVICYVSAGSWEPYRDDSAQFPEAVRGNALDGWPDERWLDVRQLEVLKPLMAKRFDVCAAKGFDAVEPDNVDGYANATGFDLTAADQIAYLTMLTELAHERGLAIGQKNAVDLVEQLAPVMDFAVNESCFEYDECELLKPYIERNKAVFHAEYDANVSTFCPDAMQLGLSSIRKNNDLDAYRESC